MLMRKSIIKCLLLPLLLLLLKLLKAFEKVGQSTGPVGGQAAVLNVGHQLFQFGQLATDDRQRRTARGVEQALQQTVQVLPTTAVVLVVVVVVIVVIGGSGIIGGDGGHVVHLFLELFGLVK